MKAQKPPPVSIERCDCPSPKVHRGDILPVTMGLKNHTRKAQSLLVWFDVTSSEGTALTEFPFFKPVALSLEPEQAVEQDAHVHIPYSAGAGDYLLCLVLGSTEEDRWDERRFEISVVPQRELERNRCNLCGVEMGEESIIRRDPSIRLAKCPACGLVFDFDMEDTISLLYELRQACGGGLTFQKNTPSIIRDYDRKNELVLGAEIDRICRRTGSAGKRLLDFGCGTGGLLAEARKTGFEVFGIETSEAAVEYGRSAKELPLYLSMEELRRERGEDPFDVIVVRHTLEHLSNPRQTLQELRTRIRPGGLLVIIVPYFNFVARWILPNSMPRFSYGLVHKGHQYYFTKNTLSAYLTQAGFPVIEYHYSILGGFLARWMRGAEDPAQRRLVAAASKVFSRLLHTTRLSPVLTAYARAADGTFRAAP